MRSLIAILLLLVGVCFIFPPQVNAALIYYGTQSKPVKKETLLTKVSSFMSHLFVFHAPSNKSKPASLAQNPQTNSKKQVLAAEIVSPQATSLSFPSSLDFAGMTNLLRNSSFEVETSGAPRGWSYILDSTTGNTFISPESIRSGKFGLKFAGGGTGNFGISQPGVQTVPQRTYTFSVYIKAVNASSSTVRIRFWDQYNNKEGTFKNVSFSGTKEWSRISVTVPTPGLITDSSNYYPMIQVKGLTSGNIYIDDAQLEEGSILTLYNSSLAYTGNASLGDGSILTTPGGDIYPLQSGTGHLGSTTNTFQDLNLANASIDKDGNLNLAGSATIGNSLTVSGLTANGVLYADGSSKITALTPGTAGYILQSNGSGSAPSWVANSGSSSNSFTSLTVGSSGQFTIDSNGATALTYSGDTGSGAQQGAVYLNNSSNVGNGLAIYSNAGSSANGNLVNLDATSPNFQQAALHVNYNGTSNAVEITNDGNDVSSNALAVTGNNINDSTLGIIGYELGKGTIKISHYRPTGLNDNNASGISIDLRGSGTAAQGLYVNSTEPGGTTGDLLRLRNETIDKFVVDYQGNLSQGGYGMNTTYTKYGNTTGDQFFIGTNGAFRVQRSASNSEAFRVQVNGDAQGRWLGTSDGRLKWGDGTSTQDITLRRGSAGVLFLDGALVMNNSNGALDTVIKGVADSNLLYADATNSRLGIGTSTPKAGLDIEKNLLGNAALIINQQGLGDLFTASSSGTAKFTVSNGGNLALSGTTTFNGQTYTWPSGGQASGYTLTTDGLGTLSWTAGNTSNWQRNSGALSPANITDDLLIGGTATASAKFRVVSSTGNVGIGTGTIADALQISGGGVTLDNAQGFKIKDSGGTARNLLFYTAGNNVQILNPATTGQVQIGINNASNNSAVLFTTNSNQERMRIDTNGNIGLGTASPVFRLDAVDTQNSTSSGSITNLSTSDTSSTNVLSLNLGTATTGTNARFIQFYAGANTQRNAIGVGRIQLNNGNVAYNTGGADFAEYFSKGSTPLSQGDIVSIGSDGNATLATEKTGAIGIVSSTAGFIGNAPHDETQEQQKVIVGLIGQLPVKVSAENGNVQPGDSLTFSSVPGVAMKATKPGIMIGKALDFYTNNDLHAVGTVKVLIAISWGDPSLQIADNGNLTLHGQSIPSSPLPTIEQTTQPVSTDGWTQVTDSISQLQSKTASLSAQVGKIDILSSQLDALQKAQNISTQSSILTNEDTTFGGKLQVTGKTLLSDVGITGSLSMGLLHIEGMTTDASPSAAIDTLSGDLKLQSLGLGGIDILKGKVTIDTDGNLKTVGIITAKEIRTDKLDISSTDQAAASLGKAVLPKGQTSLVIKTSAVHKDSVVFTTPNTKIPFPLSVTSQKDGESFTVEIDKTFDQDINFSWWIVN